MSEGRCGGAGLPPPPLWHSRSHHNGDLPSPASPRLPHTHLYTDPSPSRRRRRRPATQHAGSHSTAGTATDQTTLCGRYEVGAAPPLTPHFGFVVVHSLGGSVHLKGQLVVDAWGAGEEGSMTRQATVSCCLIAVGGRAGDRGGALHAERHGCGSGAARPTPDRQLGLFVDDAPATTWVCAESTSTSDGGAPSLPASASATAPCAAATPASLAWSLTVLKPPAGEADKTGERWSA